MARFFLALLLCWPLAIRASEYALKLWTVEDRLPGGPVVGLAQTADGYLWLVTPFQLIRFNGTTFLEIRVPAEIKSRVGLFTSIAAAPGNPAAAVAVCGRLGVARYAAGEWKTIEGAAVSDFRDDAAEGAHAGRTGRLWIHDGRNISYSTGNGVWTSIGFPLNADAPAVMLEVSDGSLWIGNPTGLFRWHSGAWQRITEQDTFGSLSVNKLLEDRDGTLWAACDGGLLRVRRNSVSTLNAEGKVVSGTAYSIWRLANGGAWIGYKGRAIKVNAQGRLLMTHYLEPDVPVSALLQDRAGHLWIGTLGAGIYTHQGEAFLRHIEPSTPASATHTLYAFLETVSGEIWAASQQGLMRITPDRRLEPVSLGGRVIDEPVRALYRDASNETWICCERGSVLRVSPDNRVTRIGREDGLIGTPRAVYRDARGNIWLGTTAGLELLRNGRAVPVGRQLGLSDDAVMLIAEDRQERLWLGTIHGLQAVRIENPSVLGDSRQTRPGLIRMIHLGVADGLVSPRCMGGLASAGPLSDPHFWFPFEDGVTVVTPSEIHFASRLPSVVIEEVQVGGRRVYGNEQPAIAGGLTFPPGARNIVFRFAALSPGNPGSARYQFKVGTESDPGWSDVQAEPTAAFEWLPPGRHTLRVIAETDGSWNVTGTSVTFDVQAYFWQTFWFYLSLAGVAALVIGLLTRWQLRHRYQLQMALLKREEALAQERARISRDIHDDLGNGLSVVATLSELAQNEVEKPAAHKRLDQIYDVANELARNVDEIVWAVNPANDGWEPFVSYFEQYTEYFLGNSGLRFHFVRPPELTGTTISSKMRHHLLLAVREAIGNVLKHASATQVEIVMRVEGGDIVVRVEDNGKGFDPAAKREVGHDGLGNMARRMKEVSGSFAIESRPGKGTAVTFRAPLH